MTRTFVAAAAALCAALSAFGQAPKTVAQVPAYPGARLVSSEQQPTDAELAAGTAPDFVLAAEKLWSTPDSADQVARFYAGKLGAAIGQEGGGDAAMLAPGRATAVASSAEYYGQGFLDDAPAALRAGFAKRPRLSADEGWARSAVFAWAYKSLDEDEYAFELSIADTSLSEDDPGRYAQGTEIRLTAYMMNQRKLAALQAGSAKDAAAWQDAKKSEEAWGQGMKEISDRSDAQAQARQAELDRVFGHAPGAAELGVPVFPGAAYDKDQSVIRSGFSTKDGRCYAYFVESSGDVRGKIEEVTRFYEQRTATKRLDLMSSDTSQIVFGFYPPERKGDKPAAKDMIVVGFDGSNGMISIWIYKDLERGQGGGR